MLMSSKAIKAASSCRLGFYQWKELREKTKMEEKLITAVSGFLELHHVSLFIYNGKKKKTIWKPIPLAAFWKCLLVLVLASNVMPATRAPTGNHEACGRKCRWGIMLCTLDRLTEYISDATIWCTAVILNKGSDFLLQKLQLKVHICLKEWLNAMMQLKMQFLLFLSNCTPPSRSGRGSSRSFKIMQGVQDPKKVQNH